MPRIWTDEDKKRQAEVARRSKLWEKSTGPISKGGKAVSSQNALKHGLRSEGMAALKKALREQSDRLED